jgi:5-methylcytosine-specific restriction endonuclease McrA
MLNHKPKTNLGMLPQFQALGADAADTHGSARNGRQHTATVQPVRGEEKPAVTAAEKCGVTRAFVLSPQGDPLMPCSNARARILIKKGKATIFRLFPFAIQLTHETAPKLQPVAIKFDPGARATGIALTRLEPDPTRQSLLHLAELAHRGQSVRKHITQRAMFRRRRRSANLRYRAPRFRNRTRQPGWLPPSLQSRVDNIATWLSHYRKLAPITSIYVESVRFDMQALEHPDIEGLDYQRGTLFGAELWEYLLAKWGRQCAYCDRTNVPLEAEHIVPKAALGSNRVSNLTLACHTCNTRKAAQSIHTFLAHDPNRLHFILSHTKAPLAAAAAVNITRLAIHQHFIATGLFIQSASGGRTKFNRTQLGIPKTHALDAACVGELNTLDNWRIPTLFIKATGRGSYQRTRLDRFGFPRARLTRQKFVHGFQTGDLVKAVIPHGKFRGTHQGRLAVRARGSFVIQTPKGNVETHYRHCIRLMHNDGYTYTHRPKPGSDSPAS